MTDKQITKLREALLKQENEAYKVIRGIHKIVDNGCREKASTEIARANKLAESLRKLRLQLPETKNEESST